MTPYQRQQRLSTKAIIADWSKQAKHKSNMQWGGRRADGPADNQISWNNFAYQKYGQHTNPYQNRQ